MLRVRVYALVAIAAIVAGATYAVVSAKPVPKGLAWQALLNATYPVSLRPSGVQLRDGLFEAEAAPGSASKILVRLADIAAFGEIDGAGGTDAAVVLVSSGGGSGTFVELGAVLNDAGTARPVATTLLGDRVLVREVRVGERTVIVRMRARGATDPLTLRTREITRTYALEDGKLVLRQEAETDVPTPPADAFVYRTERVEIPPGGLRTLNSRLAPGTIASYVVHAKAGQILDLRVRSEFDNAVLSVFGLADGVQLVTRRDYVTERAVPLSVDQDYAVKVVSLAGQDLPFELQIGLRAPAITPTALPSPSIAPLPSRTPAVVPTSRPDRAISEISSTALSFARTRPPVWAIAVYVPATGITYAENADEQLPTASVVKVLIMLTLLEQARSDHRPLTEDELQLLWPMITESDNDATSELWERVGRGQAVASYVRGIGAQGFTPDPETSWGVSFVSARAMATVLGRLIAGDILDDASRALALRLLESVIPEQRWGVTAATADGDRVGVKDGWYPGEEGWRVNSAGVVRPNVGPGYAIAVMTDGRASWQEGIDTIQGIAGPINAALLRR